MAKPYTIHLVHGTFANHRLPFGKPKWFEDGHPFFDAVAGVAFELDATVESFTWGWGPNLHTARIRAAAALRKKIAGSEDESRHILIGHSHGGNICMLACNDEETRRRVCGIACLSTPFIVLRKARYADRTAVIFALLLAAALSFWLLNWWGFSLGRFIAVVLMLLPMIVASTFLWEWISFKEADIELPRSLPHPVLILRTPGDEATGILGVLSALEWAMMIWFDKAAKLAEWFVLKYDSVVFAVLFNLALLWVLFSGGPVKSVLTWVAVAVVAPLMLILPLRMLFRLPHGWDLGIRGLPYLVSADASPPGEWTVTTVTASTATSSPNLPLTHAQVYEIPDGQELVVRWLKRVCEEPEAREPQAAAEAG